MERWNQIFIASHKSFFIVFGIFGNVNLVYIILTTPRLRNKSSYLQALQSTAHIFCILNSFIDVYLMLSDSRIPRDLCFYLIAPTTFCFCFQTAIMLFILLDMLFAVLFPFALRGIDDWKYVLAMSLAPGLWGAGMVIWSSQNLDDTLLTLCAPPTTLHREAYEVLFPVTVIINTLSLVVFVALLVTFRKKVKTNIDCSRVMKHLRVSAAVFIGSIYFSIFGANLVMLLGVTGDAYTFMIGNLSINAMFSYSHTFYTIIWRSSEYRKRFLGMYYKNAGAQVSNPPSHAKKRSLVVSEHQC